MARTRDAAAFAALAESCTRGRVGLQSRAAGADPDRGHPGRQGRPGRRGARSVTASSCCRSPPASAPPPVRRRTPTARCSTNCCAPTACSGQDAPAAIEMFSGRGQPSCEQLIDRYRIACRPVRDVLVDYLRERQPSVDFSTLQRLAYLLGKLFWADLEAHHPGIDSLQAAPRGRRGLEAAGDDPHRRTTTGRRRADQADRAAAGRAQRADRGARLLPRPRRVGRRRPGPLGGRGRCAARSPPATSRTRRTAPNASPGWTNAPANGCRCCPPWSPGWTPNAPAPPNCSPPPRPPGPASRSPPPGRRCAARS